jgi:hypothetical protein
VCLCVKSSNIVQNSELFEPVIFHCSIIIVVVVVILLPSLLLVVVFLVTLINLFILIRTSLRL